MSSSRRSKPPPTRSKQQQQHTVTTANPVAAMSIDHNNGAGGSGGILQAPVADGRRRRRSRRTGAGGGRCSKCVDFLLCATHYRLLASMLPPKDLKTRLITEWSTIALVAALMAGFAYQGWRDGVPTDSALLQDLYAASAIFGVVAHCSSVLASVYYLGVVNTLPVHSVELFVHKFSRVLSLPPAGFISGMVALVVGLVLQCYTLSSTRVFVYSIGLLGGISVCGVGVTLWMYVVARGLMHQQAKATAAGARPVDSSDGEDDE